MKLLTAALASGALLAGSLGLITTTATAAPTASFSAPTVVVAGQSARFDASASTRAERYVWDYGDGNREITGSVTTHTFAAPGTYTVTLDVVGDGVDAFASQTVTVASATPVSTTVTPTIILVPNIIPGFTAVLINGTVVLIPNDQVPGMGPANPGVSVPAL